MTHTYLTVEEPQYQDRVYRITTHSSLPIDTESLQPLLEVVVTDGGNTVEDLDGNIIGHYVGTY